MKRQNDSQPKESELLTRILVLEKQVGELANLVANHVASRPQLLIGWREISLFCRRPRRTLSRHVQRWGFPVFRFGAHVISWPDIIQRWLIVTARARKRCTENPISGLSDDELRQRLEELDRKLKP